MRRKVVVEKMQTIVGGTSKFYFKKRQNTSTMCIEEAQENKYEIVDGDSSRWDKFKKYRIRGDPV